MQKRSASRAGFYETEEPLDRPDIWRAGIRQGRDGTAVSALFPTGDQGDGSVVRPAESFSRAEAGSGILRENMSPAAH